MQRVLSSTLAANKQKAGVSRLHVEFASKRCSAQFNGLFLNGDVRGMRNENDFRVVGRVLPITGPYTERAIGFKIMKACLLFTACYPIWFSNYCHRTMVKTSLLQNVKICAERFVQLKTNCDHFFRLSTHPHYLR